MDSRCCCAISNDLLNLNWRQSLEDINFIGEGVVNPQQLRRKILTCEARQPLTDEFEAEIARRKIRRKDPWYNSQQEHWLGWLGEYDGPGYYGRQTWDVTAEIVYKRVVNPPMVMWLGEAAGVRRAIVKAAATAALEAGDNMSAQSAAIRRIVPWDLISEVLRSNS